MSDTQLGLNKFNSVVKKLTVLSEIQTDNEITTTHTISRYQGTNKVDQRDK